MPCPASRLANHLIPTGRCTQAFRGSGARAQAVAAKLLAGQPVHVAVVGGSVTWGQGAIYGGNFGVRFFNWINATWPSPHHRFTNAAKPAVTSSLYAICGGSMVPQVGHGECVWHGVMLMVGMARVL